MDTAFPNKDPELLELIFIQVFVRGLRGIGQFRWENSQFSVTCYTVCVYVDGIV